MSSVFAFDGFTDRLFERSELSVWNDKVCVITPLGQLQTFKNVCTFYRKLSISQSHIRSDAWDVFKNILRTSREILGISKIFKIYTLLWHLGHFGVIASRVFYNDGLTRQSCSMGLIVYITTRPHPAHSYHQVPFVAYSHVLFVGFGMNLYIPRQEYFVVHTGFKMRAPDFAPRTVMIRHWSSQQDKRTSG